jgi:hypothetical protein
LLQEEFRFNRDVCAIFAKALRFDDQMKVNACRLSVVDETGETDLIASFTSGKRHGVILIENKIDAGFQPRQPERYRERAKALVLQDVLTEVYCVLVAPTNYLASNGNQSTHFDAIVFYEDIASAVAADGTLRAKYRAALLPQAVEQARTSYTLTPAPKVTNVWERIYNVALKEFPFLQMPAPSAKGSQSKWIIFKADLPPRITIDWKITKAVVDLSFWKGAVLTPVHAIDLSRRPRHGLMHT